MNLNKCICISNKNKPNEIPQSKWDLLIEGNEYTPIKYTKCNAQGGIIGVQIEEIDLSDCQPYIYFDIKRFAFPVDLKTIEKEEILEEITI